MPAHQPNSLHEVGSLVIASLVIALGIVLLSMSGRSLDERGWSASVTTLQTARVETPSDTIEECVITFTTGRVLTGLLMDSNEQSVILRINGIDTTYRRARIASIKFLPPIDERFEQIRALTPDSDIEARLLLVDWLRDRQAYAMAIDELDDILTIEPNNHQAKLLRTWLEQHLKLTKQRTTPPRAPRKDHTKVADTSQIPLLTDEQINLIRVYEIDLSNPPKFIVESPTIRALIARDPDSFPTSEKDREAIFDWSDIEQLKLLFRHKARELYSQVRVLEDPDSFVVFKKQIAGRTGWLINGCATSRCHGGSDAGGLRLSNHNPNSAASLYTNFVILDRYILPDGAKLINYMDPERSPLLQMGLVRTRSLRPHPEVDKLSIGRDWRAVFRTTKTQSFKRASDWIRSVYTPRPDYGFQYPPEPVSDPTDPLELVP